jgi:hypothetical protein
VLRAIGFVEDSSRDHVYLEYYHKGRKIVETKVSHGGGKDISRRLLGHILREQVYLTGEEFERAIRGILSTEDYRRILIEKGILRENN